MINESKVEFIFRGLGSGSFFFVRGLDAGKIHGLQTGCSVTSLPKQTVSTKNFRPQNSQSINTVSTKIPNSQIPNSQIPSPQTQNSGKIPNSQYPQK
jgi:hypothetical protein